MNSDFDDDLSTHFTDVVHLRNAFSEAISTPALTKRLFVIHGVGGVGKSSLLRMFRLQCKFDKVPVAFFRDVKRISLLDDNFLKLPSKFDIHEYEIMERFCLSISNANISKVLLDKIRGSGAFRRFRDEIYRYGIEKDWFKYRDEAYKEIAISWLENHGFAYVDDMNRREQNI